jgi:thioredoxin-like negative regulator of GroEL
MNSLARFPRRRSSDSSFVEQLVPSPADKLAAADDEESLRKALELEPRNAAAARKLGRLLLQRGDPAEALEVLGGVQGDFEADGLAARARVASSFGADGGGPNANLLRAFSAWDAGDPEQALESFQAAMDEISERDQRDLVRRMMVAIFTELGADHPVAREHRRRLAAALN